MADFKLKPEQIAMLEKSGYLSPATASLAAQSVTPAPVPEVNPANPYGQYLQGVLPPTNPVVAQEMADEGHIGQETAQQVAGLNSEMIPPDSPDAIQFEPAPVVNTPTAAISEKAQSRLHGIEGGYKKIESGIEKAARAGAEQAAKEAGYMKTAQGELERLQFDNQEKEVQRQKFMDKELSDYKGIQDQILNKSVDPNRLWASKSSGQKAMAVIGLVLGGIGSGVTGGKNVAYEIFENSIQRDVDAQKAEIEKLKDVGSAKRNMYGLYMEKFKDDRQAEAATKLTMYEQMELKMKEAAALAKSPQILANAEKALGELQVAKNAALLQFEQAAAAKVQQIQLRGGSQLPANVDIEQLTTDQRERYVPEFGLASTKEGAKEMRDHKATSDTVSGILKELIDMTNSSGKSLNPKAKARAQTLAAVLKGKLRGPIVGPGAVSESEWKLLNSIVADPTEIFSMDSVSRSSLQAVNDTMKRNLSDIAKANGLKPIGQQVSSFQPR